MEVREVLPQNRYHVSESVRVLHREVLVLHQALHSLQSVGEVRARLQSEPLVCHKRVTCRESVEALESRVPLRPSRTRQSAHGSHSVAHALSLIKEFLAHADGVRVLPASQEGQAEASETTGAHVLHADLVLLSLQSCRNCLHDVRQVIGAFRGDGVSDEICRRLESIWIHNVHLHGEGGKVGNSEGVGRQGLVHFGVECCLEDCLDCTLNRGREGEGCIGVL
mmetsp:Transcript_25331/g.49487  ORF Transcript_25331/g.49487 Transcript_25331/m.49487 type:complete len:223 (+) Transcript_25331:710-1378(+)